MAINNNKRVNVAITIALALLGLYYMWTAVGSSVCTASGIANQTRTTWAPVTGCVVDPAEQPWNKLENR
jgi:hypothetical protein